MRQVARAAHGAVIIPSLANRLQGMCSMGVLLALLLTACTAVEQEATSPTAQSPSSPNRGNQQVLPSPGATSTPQDKARDIPTAADITHPQPADQSSPDQIVALSTETLCHAVGSKLGSVTINDCLRQQLQHDIHSPLNYSLAYRDYLPVGTRIPLGRVLVIGGIHGDEYSSVSLLFKWMDILNQHHSGLFHWRFIPLANPDGLLRETSQRQNHSGVDLNRNFPTADWDDQAHRYWNEVTYNNPRRNPGTTAASELETRWLIEQIEQFRPDAIISVHAPHHLVDYDGPPRAPEKLGHLNLNKLGVFPGSLGNYAGVDLGLPVVSVELQSAGNMPAPRDIDGMWSDLIGWLRRQLTETTTAHRD